MPRTLSADSSLTCGRWRSDCVRTWANPLKTLWQVLEREVQRQLFGPKKGDSYVFAACKEDDWSNRISAGVGCASTLSQPPLGSVCGDGAVPIEGATVTFNPAFEVKETAEAFIFKADLPGLKESEVDIKVTGDRLTISGTRIAEKRNDRDTYFAYERSFGSFTRSFTLPQWVNTDLTRAEMDAGVLTITLPKLAEAQPKSIPVKSETKHEGKAKA